MDGEIRYYDSDPITKMRGKLIKIFPNINQAVNETKFEIRKIRNAVITGKQKSIKYKHDNETGKIIRYFSTGLEFDKISGKNEHYKRILYYDDNGNKVYENAKWKIIQEVID